MIIQAGQPVPGRVDLAITELMAYFAQSSMSVEDKQLKLRGYRKVCEGFSLSVVVYTLEQLIRFAPNNTFAPTPQVVFEHLQKATKLLRTRVLNWYFPEDGKPRWRQLEVEDMTKFGDDWGSEPLQPGCHVSRELVIQWVRKSLEERLEKLELDKCSYEVTNETRWMCTDIKSRIPAECWTDETKAKVAEAVAHLEYLGTLSYHERSAREEVTSYIKMYGEKGVTEAVVRERMTELLAYQEQLSGSGRVSWDSYRRRRDNGGIIRRPMSDAGYGRRKVQEDVLDPIEAEWEANSAIAAAEANVAF
jgi:hypothetical protein